MKRENKSFGIGAIASFVFAVCGIFFSVYPAQAATVKAGTAAAREVRVVTQTTTAGQTITVVLEADTMGDESIYGFSLNYNTAILTYVPNSIAIGSGATASGGTCNVQANPNTAGRFGFSVVCPGTITAGNNRPLVTLRFTVASNAPSGSTPLTFGDTPTSRSVSSDPAASGPVMNLPTAFTDGAVNIAAANSNRAVRVVSQNTNRSSTVTLVLAADAMGDESIYGFSLNYNTAILTYVPNSIKIGSGATASGGTCNVQANPNTAGRFGFSVECPGTITAGNNRPLVTLQFTVASNAPNGQTPLTFGDAPASRSVSSDPAGAGPIMDLPTAFFNGFLNIAVPTAAAAPISGKVSAAGRPVRGAVVYLTGSSGVTRSVQTNSFGYYRFNQAEVGGTYTIVVRHKTYQFAPRVISVFAAIGNLDFNAKP